MHHVYPSIIRLIKSKGKIMTFEELLKRRRSVRNFKDVPVSIEVIKEMIKESTLAPNAGNDQPWKFIIVNNKQMMKRISDESKKNILSCVNANTNEYAKKYKALLEKESFNVFYNAPNLVLILGVSTVKDLYLDCSLAAGYFMFAAASRNIDTCWVNLGAEIYDQQMRNELGIPDDCKIVAPIILGYAEKVPPIPKRKEPEILKIIT